MKVLILTLACALVAGCCCSASPLVVPATINTGSSNQYRSQDNLGQYSFGYDEAGATGGSFRHEKSDVYGNRVGSYGLTGADGRVRIVNYVADANGYRANVQTNEPGTEPRDAASVSMNRGPVALAPVAVAAVAPAPLALPAPVALAPAAPAYLPAPVPLYRPAPAPAPVLGYGFSVINHHLAPLPVAY